MKKHILVPIVFGGLITFSLTTQAQDRPGQGGRGGEGGRGGANPREGIREAMIKKFDKNGDGKLDEDERPSREEMQEFLRTQLGGGQNQRITAPSVHTRRAAVEHVLPGARDDSPSTGKPNALVWRSQHNDSLRQRDSQRLFAGRYGGRVQPLHICGTVVTP